MSFTYATEDGPLLLDAPGRRPLRRRRRQPALHHRQGQGPQPDLPFQVRGRLQGYLRPDGAVHGTSSSPWPRAASERDGSGQITSNSFMKRDFGAPLIEKFLSHHDLRLVADTSGAYIPGHGTPTVIIVGRNQRPVGPTVRAVLGVRGEPGQPPEPAKGLVWTSINEHVDSLGWNDGWITVADLDRGTLASHPWSLAGGGAVQLLEIVEARSPARLSSKIAPPIGRAIRAGADEAFARPFSWKHLNMEEIWRYVAG